MERKSYSSMFSGQDSPGNDIRSGTVISVNPRTFTAVVKMPDIEGAMSVGMLNIYGASYGEDLVWLQNIRGAEVLLIKHAGQYYILGTKPVQVTKTDDSVVDDVTDTGHGGASELSYRKRLDYRSMNPNRPSDFMPGDKIIRADDGAEIGLFRGGVAVLKGSPMAQIILGKIKDFLKIISRRVEWFTDFGELLFKHDASGKVGMEIHGGANYGETHPGAAQWTVQAWLGDYPSDSQSRLYVRVNDPGNGQFVTLRMGTDGTIEMETSKDKMETIGEAADEQVGTTKLSVSNGAMTLQSHTAVYVTAPVIHMNR